MGLLDTVLDNTGTDVREHRGGERTICCPFCVERGATQDFRFRLGINVESGLGHCYNCDWKSSDLLFTARELCRAFGLKLSWRDSLGVKPGGRKIEASAAEPEEEPEPLGLPEDYQTWTKNPDVVERYARRYLQKRGITTDQILRHRIGFVETGQYSWRVIVPVIGPRDEVYGLVTRALTRQQKPKYLNSEGVKLMWNGQRRAKEGIWVEGVFDGLAVERILLAKGLDAVPVSTLGSAVTRYQLDQLKKFERVVYLPDQDPAGVQGAIKCCDMAQAAGINVWVAIPRVMDGQDPGSMPPGIIERTIDNAIAYSEAARKLLRLSATRGDRLS